MSLELHSINKRQHLARASFGREVTCILVLPTSLCSYAAVRKVRPTRRASESLPTPKLRSRHSRTANLLCVPSATRKGTQRSQVARPAHERGTSPRLPAALLTLSRPQQPRIARKYHDARILDTAYWYETSPAASATITLSHVVVYIVLRGCHGAVPAEI